MQPTILEYYFNSSMIFSMIVSVLATLVILLYSRAMHKNKETRNLPPGPLRLPIIGTTYWNMLENMESYLPKFKRYYGDLTLLYWGPRVRVVSLNTIKAVNEAFITNAQTMSHRGIHQSYTFSRIHAQMKGILLSDYDVTLQDNRRLTSSILRTLGVGRSMLEEKIIEEAERLCESIRNVGRKDFDPSHIINCSVANVILSVFLNIQHKHDDPELLKLIDVIDSLSAAWKYTRFIDCLNFLRFIPPFRSGFKLMVSANKDLKQYVRNAVNDHLKQYEKGMVSDFVDCWIERHSSSAEQLAKFDEENLQQVLRDMLIAGIETVATSLKWVLIRLANNPEIQAKIHHEIDRVIGKDRPICLAEKDRLPYLEAFICEIQRTKMVLPFSPRFTKQATTLCGYNIPANTLVFANYMGIQMDGDTFEQPNQFRPERFLDSRGRFTKHPLMVQYGIGKRSCIGEKLARQELFLFTAIFMQRFKIVLPDGAGKINENGVENFTLSPHKFKICVIPL